MVLQTAEAFPERVVVLMRIRINRPTPSSRHPQPPGSDCNAGVAIARERDVV
jgi:hypothetical protein